MSDDFLDSNVFLYSLDSENPGKRDVAFALMGTALKERNVSISFQVIQEVLNGISRRVRPNLDPDDASRFIETFLDPLWDVMPSRRLYDEAYRLHSRYQFPFYDALIVAAALEAGCSRLISEDFQHGQIIDSLRIENPFLGL